MQLQEGKSVWPEGERGRKREKRQKWKEREGVGSNSLSSAQWKTVFLRAVANTPEPRNWSLRSQASVTLAGDLAK